MKRTSRIFSGAAVGGTLALAFGASAFVAPAAADDGDADKTWEETASELLFDDGAVALSGGADDANQVQSVGVDRNGQTVVKVSGLDEEFEQSLKDEYGEDVIVSEGTFEATAATDTVGGAGILMPADNPESMCSLGFAAWDPAGEPAGVTAGHCTNDGAYATAMLSQPSHDGGDEPGAGPELGDFGFSQFGGAGNSEGTEADSTDIAVIDNVNSDLDLKPEVTDWTTAGDDDLAASTTDITGTGSVDPNGPDVERSGRTTGHATASSDNVEEVDGWALIDGRAVRGFAVEDIAVDGGDSGGPVYQGETAIGITSGKIEDGGVTTLWAAHVEDALSYTDGYTLQLKVDAPEVTSPGEGDEVAAGDDISGTAVPNSTVVITSDEGDDIEVDVDGDGNWSFAAPDELGTYDFTAMTKDGYNESDEVEYSVEITMSNPTIEDPADGDRVTDAITEISGNGFDGATLTVEVDGEEVDTTEVDDGEWAVDADIDEYGTYTLTASQELDGEESDEVTSEVTLAPAAPEITVPTDGDSFSSDELPDVVEVEGTGLEDATVTLFLDGDEVGTADIGDADEGEDGDGETTAAVITDEGDWGLEVDETLDVGEHTFEAIQTVDEVDSDKSNSVGVEVTEPADDGADDGDDGEDHEELPDTGVDGLVPGLGAAAMLVLLGGVAVVRKQRLV